MSQFQSCIVGNVPGLGKQYSYNTVVLIINDLKTNDQNRAEPKISSFFSPLAYITHKATYTTQPHMQQ